MARGPVGRRGVGVLDLTRRLDAGTILMTLLVLGLALRVFIAAFYLPLSGLANDIGAFNAWGQRLASLGPAEFYEPGYFADYPPGYMYVLWLLGSVGGALTPLVGQNATGGLVKIPGVLADVGVAWLLFVICRRWGGELIDRSRFPVNAETLGLAAAVIYLFNPGTIFDSAVWGQIDSVGTLVLLATIYALARGWTEMAAIGAVVALLIKFQFAFLIPIVAIVGIRRHLLGRSTDPEHDEQRDPLRALTSIAVGIGTLTILMLPFGMLVYAPLEGGDPRGLLGFLPAADPSRSLIGKLIEAAGTYTGLTENAFNLWRNPWSGLGDTLQRGSDSGVGLVIGSLSLTWQQVGFVLFAAVALLALVHVARRDDVRGVLLAALLLSIAFFVLPTRVHERYLFPALALAAPLVLSGRTWPWIYGALSLVFFANVYWVYTEDWSFTGRVINPGAFGQPMPQSELLTATLLTDWGIWLISLTAVLVLGTVAWQALRQRAVSIEPERDAGAVAPCGPPGGVGGGTGDLTRAAGRPRAPAVAGPQPRRRLPARAEPAARPARRAHRARARPVRPRLQAVAPRRPARPPLRRGLPRPVRRGVALQLAERLEPRRLRVDAPDAGQVPHRGRHRGGRSEQGRRQLAARRAVARDRGRHRALVDGLGPIGRLHRARRWVDDPGRRRRDRRRDRPLERGGTDRQPRLRRRRAAPAGGPRRHRHGRRLRACRAPRVAGRPRAAGRAPDRHRPRGGQPDRCPARGRRAPLPRSRWRRGRGPGHRRGPRHGRRLVRRHGVRPGHRRGERLRRGHRPGTQRDRVHRRRDARAPRRRRRRGAGRRDDRRAAHRATADPGRRRRPAAAGAHRAASGERRAPGDVRRPCRPRRRRPERLRHRAAPRVPVAHRPPGRRGHRLRGRRDARGRAGGLADRAAHRRSRRHERRPRGLRRDPVARSGPGDELRREHRRPGRRPRQAARQHRRRHAGPHRRGEQRVRLAPRRRRLRGHPRRPHLPPRGDDVRQAPDRRPRGGIRGDRRHELRHEPHLDERHLRGGLHRGGLPGLLAGLVRPMGAQRLVGPAARRRPDRPCGLHEMGRLLCAGGAVGARPGPIGPRPADARRAGGLRRRGRGHRRAVAVPGGDAARARGRTGDRPRPPHPLRRRGRQDRAARHRRRPRRGRPRLCPRV